MRLLVAALVLASAGCVVVQEGEDRSGPLSIAARFVDTPDGLDPSAPMPFSNDPIEYRIEVELGDGRRAHADFSVKSLNAEEAPSLKIDLR